MRRLVWFVKAAHPGPSLAVTTVGTALAAADGKPARTCILLALALLTGQLSIGWCNDATDRARDVAAGRRDKPVALGLVPTRAVGAAAGAAAAVCVPLSFALGAAAGTVHLVVVSGGWAYDLAAKRTAASFVPFVVSFGLLPAVATLALPHPAVPQWWATVSGALLGVVAHLANALPDLADDVNAGVLGLPQRLGPRTTRGLAGALLVVAAAVLVVAPRARLGAGGAAIVVVAALGLVAAFGRRWPQRSRAPFVFTALAALAVVGLLLARGAAIT